MTPSPWDLVAEHLARARSYLCHGCLAKNLGIPVAVAVRATLDLQWSRAFAVQLGSCGQCHAERQVIRYLPVTAGARSQRAGP